jgi:hypothetical protein
MSKDYYKEQIDKSEPIPIDFDAYDHNRLEQLAKREKAEDKITSKKIHADHGDYYEVEGSKGEIYQTSISSCTCADFKNPNSYGPCKHIYRYALDHNRIDPLPTASPEKTKLFNEQIPSELARFQSYYEDGLISARKYLCIVRAINSSPK